MPDVYLDVPRPIRVHRNRLLKAGELERTIELAARQASSEGHILLLLDADDDCPRALAPDILQRASRARSDRRISVVLAKHEYEAWFLAAASSIAEQRGLGADTAKPVDPESIRDAKGWLTSRMPPGRSYRATLDQPALSATIDLEQARSAASFDKLGRDVTGWLR